jgi:hypothetical protein
MVNSTRFATIALLALCIGVCALADAIIRVATMTEETIFAAAMLTLAGAILAALYGVARNASPQRQQQSHRHRPWNFK